MQEQIIFVKKALGEAPAQQHRRYEYCSTELRCVQARTRRADRQMPPLLPLPEQKSATCLRMCTFRYAVARGRPVHMCHVISEARQRARESSDDTAGALVEAQR